MSQKFIILEGKDLNILIDEGLKKLNADREQVKVEVLEKGKTLMGVSIRNYKVKLTLNHSSREERLLDRDVELAKQLIKMDKNKSIESSFYRIEYLDDGVYLNILDRDTFQSNSRQALEFIRKKKIDNIDISAIEEAINSKEKSRFKIAPKQEEVLLDAELKIDISNDGLCAFITLIPPSGGKDISVDEAFEKVQDCVKYGLNVNLLKKVINEKCYNSKTLIAEGEKAIDGEDGYIKYFFPVTIDTTPRVLEDGSVDFRNLDIIHNVRAGDILAELILPTDGKQGNTVYGKTIEGKKGKKKEFRYGKNVKVSEDGKNLIAEKDGQVCIQDNKVMVKEVFEVKGNIDNSTGNINFNGTIKIKGNVLTGFEVNADGDVEIEGVVEGAKVSSLGNIILKRGIQGYNKGKLFSKGTIVARYIENSFLEADSDIISDAIMHSEVISNGSIKVTGKKGLIVGGTCKAATEIVAKTIGSTMATATVLEVGVYPNLRSKHDAIKGEIEEIESNIKKFDQSIALFNRMSKNGELTEEKEKTLNKVVQARAILVKNLESHKKEMAYILKQIDSLSRGKIKVENVIYPGVKVVIGNSTMFIRDEIKHCTLYIENNEIKIGPYDF
ncbi:hypothetical protein DW1_1854 [Proteiniborus sp. DW1]|uniref:FapA family protein n=1 Tax=Proteiniborus sp. DW1 TaxID=1889883 RepID=UPI00092DF78A|nr:FapA family protein [Proteiniborus sp. DW1]SCG83422.1 hypothetical protein DW1_1854 [Proteiniborus sp. DW1]